MSYDVYLHVSGGGDYAVTAYDRNHTSNTSGVWREAGCDITEFDGKSAKKFGKSLTKAIARIEADRSHYDQFVRGGGTWGTVETTLDFLVGLRDACERYPAAIVSVSH